MDWQRFVAFSNKVHSLSRKGWTFILSSGEYEVIFDGNHLTKVEGFEDFVIFIEGLKQQYLNKI